MITTLEGRVQIEFGNTNAKFDDFTTRFKALGLLAMQTRIEKEERHALGMMTTLSLNQFM